MVVPVDDIPLHGPFPPGFETLADSFVDSNYDLRELVRTIVSTEAFQRDSRLADQPVTSEHEVNWAVFPLTQLRPEQVAASLLQACRLQMIDNESSIIAKLQQFAAINDFTKEYGDRGEDEFISQNITLPQRLIVMNGELLGDQVNGNPVANASTQIALLAASDEQAIKAAYLSTLNRLPTESERQAFSEEFSGERGRRKADAVGDLFWILLNSSEFLWNH